MTLAKNLACPIDGGLLVLSGRQLSCAEGHSFDLAREGYVNLLPVQHKKSKHPGDSKEMVLARRQFLASTAYAPIANKLAEVVAAYLPAVDDLTLVDAGCGEGYYLDCLRQQLFASRQVNTLGVDISKPAIVSAAKKYKHTTWLVGSNHQLPLLPNSVDVVLCLFGFPAYGRFKSLLKPGGIIVLVDPGPEHLIELRELIYPTVKRKAVSTLHEAEALGFTLSGQVDLQYQCKGVNQAQLQNLTLMTPHFYRASSEGKAAVAQLAQLDLSVDVCFRALTVS